jgi:hypothetical protein
MELWAPSRIHESATDRQVPEAFDTSYHPPDRGLRSELGSCIVLSTFRRERSMEMMVGECHRSSRHHRLHASTTTID